MNVLFGRRAVCILRCCGVNCLLPLATTTSWTSSSNQWKRTFHIYLDDWWPALALTAVSCLHFTFLGIVFCAINFFKEEGMQTSHLNHIGPCNLLMYQIYCRKVYFENQDSRDSIWEEAYLFVRSRWHSALPSLKVLFIQESNVSFVPLVAPNWP